MSAIVAIIDFKGNSSKTYSFDVYPINEECPRESGVYVFTKRTLNSSTFKYEHNICFIGSAVSQPNKLYNHQKEHCINKHAANSVCYLAVPIVADRKIIEQDLLKAGNTMYSEAKGAGFLPRPDYLPY
jgi:hypothetical protein